MCGDVLRHHGGTAFHTYDDTVLPRMAEIPGENIGLRGGGRRCVHCSTDLPGRGIVGSWDRGSAMSCRASNISTVYMSAPAALFIYASACTLSDPDLLKPKNPSTSVRWLPGLLCGVGPRVGTPKPTSPLRRRRHYLATLRVSGPKKYADRLATASGPARAILGRSGRVSFKGSQSKDHSGRRPR